MIAVILALFAAIVVFRRKGGPEPAVIPSPPPAVASVGCSDDAELTVLGDERSAAFYVKVVRTLSDEDIRYRLGSVKQALQEGASVDTARKMFTSSVKKRAKDLGRDL